MDWYTIQNDERIQGMIRTMPRWFISKNGLCSEDDLRQDLCIIFRNMDEICDEDGGIAYGLIQRQAKCRLIDVLKSKKYNNTWNNQREHVSWEALLKTQDSPDNTCDLDTEISARSNAPRNSRAFRDPHEFEARAVRKIMTEEIEAILTERESIVLWGLAWGYPQWRIGQWLGCTRSLVSKIAGSARRKIREKMECT